MGESLKATWFRIDIYVGCFLVIVASAAAGAAVMNWFNARERITLIERFPVVRAEERAACTREFSAQIDGLKRLNEQGAQALVALQSQMNDTHNVVAYTLRFLGDRAKISDARTAAMLKQARAAAVAANTAAEKTEAVAQKTEVVEQKVTVAATKADEAASTAKATEKKLDTATHPTAVVPSTPWAGNRR
jgi:hypothetical protein